MKAILQLVFKEALSRPGWALLFILSLSFGLCGLSTLELLKSSFQKQLQENARDLFGADIIISSPGPLPDHLGAVLKKQLPEGYITTRKTSLNTMVKIGERFRLVRVHGIEKNWPFYGKLEADGYQGENWRNQFHESPTVLVDPQLASLLKSKGIKNLKIGKQKFQILGTARKSNGVANLDFRLSPELFIARSFLENTGLIAFGSRVRFQCSIKLASGEITGSESKEIYRKIRRAQIGGRTIRVRDYKSAMNRANQALKNFETYLALIGMIALLLSVCGTSVLHANYLEERIPEIALLRVLGLSKPKTYLVQILKLAVFGVLASMIAILLSVGIVQMMTKVVADILPGGLAPSLSPSLFLAVLLPGVSGAVIPCLPALRSLEGIRISGLLSGSTLSESKSSWRDGIFLLSLLVVLLWIYLLSSFQSGSLKLGAIFTLCILCASLVLALVGKLLMKISSEGFHLRRFTFSYTLLDLSRTPTSTLLSLVSIGLSTLMICVLPQVESSLRANIYSKINKIPDFFFFEILPEQVDELSLFCEKEGILLSNPIPMIRSELTKINSINLRDYLKEYKSSNPQSRYGDMLLRRGANLTYRKNDQLGPYEKIVEGKKEFGSDSEFPEISLERRFAQNLGLKINDILEFDIQGLEYKGRVVNLRKVRWNSYEPNFFIQGSEKDLQDYPSSFLATISVKPGFDRFQIHSKILERFSNFSSVDLQATLKQVMMILSKIAYGIYFLALVALICGFVVLFSITHFEIYREAWKWNLLRVLGASRGKLRALVMLRCFLLSGLASLTAFCLSYPISYVLWKSFFKNFEFDIQLTNPLIFTIFIPFCSTLVGLLVSREILRQKPASLFQSV